MQPVVIDRGDVGLRVDLVLLRHLRHVPGVTRNRLQRLIADGAVEINGRVITRSSMRLSLADTLTVALPARPPRVKPAAESLPIDVVYEDDSLLIVNKPAGQVAHPAFRNTSGTLLNALLAHAGGTWQPALVSRLDKDTSGLLLVAKGGAVQAALQKIGDRNGIEKDYLAVVFGKPPGKGTIDLALDRDPWDRRRVTVRDRGGARSVTKFQRMRVIPSDNGTFVSLVKCRLVTGRTHQIRVHLLAKGWPIVGDPIYKGHSPARPTLGRQALHAWRLAFTHPVTAARIDVTAPLPADIEQLLIEAGHIE